MTIKNNYLIKNLDDALNTSALLKKHYGRFLQELVHSTFLIAYEESDPIILDVDGRSYAFIFTDEDEFRKSFPNDKFQSGELEMDTLIHIIKGRKLDGYILNASSQNFYMNRKLLNGLDDIPCECLSCESYDNEMLKQIRDSVNNEHIEWSIEMKDDLSIILERISEITMFALVVSDRDMDILEVNGMVQTFGITEDYDFYTHNGYVALFTGEYMTQFVETSKFKYLAVANVSSLAHHAISQELKGVIINPGHGDYIISTDELLKNWNFINTWCNDERLGWARYNFFRIDK